MSLAADTREAVRRSPYLLVALRAGVVNFAAAARSLGVSEDTEAVAAALRRMADRLPPLETAPVEARLTMRSGILPEAGSEPVLSVGQAAFSDGDGRLTAVVARGAVDAAVLHHALGVCHANGVEVLAGGIADGELALVVARRHGPDALRLLEAALDAVPR